MNTYKCTCIALKLYNLHVQCTIRTCICMHTIINIFISQNRIGHGVITRTENRVLYHPKHIYFKQ